MAEASSDERREKRGAEQRNAAPFRVCGAVTFNIARIARITYERANANRNDVYNLIETTR